MNQINQFFKTYRWCVALAFAGGCAVATIAYNVMGRAVGFKKPFRPLFDSRFLYRLRIGIRYLIPGYPEPKSAVGKSGSGAKNCG
ncbi:MAG: hypothetical protein HOI96_12150 [Rhodospirillaceae bacterium]|nr:hypothetical protein [Rhodospirillaceae bacterium]